MIRLLGMLLLLCGGTASYATEWNVSLWGSRRAFTEHVEKLAHYVEKDSKGSFKINISYGGLASNRENLEGIAADQFEMAQFCSGYHPEKNRGVSVLELPFHGVDTLEEEQAVSFAVYQHPAVAAEMAKWNAKLLMPTPLPQYNIVGRGEAPQGLGWFEGKTLRATGGVAAALRSIGTETVNLTATETFDAMQGGIVDGASFAQHAHFSFKTIDLAEWWTANLNPGSTNCPVVVNIKAYEALSDEHRAILDAAVEPSLEHYLEYYTDLINKWSAILEMFGVERVQLPDAQIEEFRATVAAPVREAWIAQADSEGLPGAELVNLIDQTLTAYREGQTH
ncbi:C4-dicarboxylate ABC transporter substrate-binding protein [Algicella marina]|uniref:C4-dicarboxylate ABC transporter substrate-binding protein n=1 Tax=Algicella marina TaxID=2683284 RepID=A0A6P1T1K7_9RHOB|nr:C4-dicarboxylate ABC transporter substrate-binding protein [Algicella marina]QHQ35645.1 C4-dicarboxylate ABC transporter substrate-binding protein [Algicella marina]